MSKPTYEELHKLFEYDPQSGTLIRKITVSGQAKTGDIAGTFSNGYLNVTIKKKHYYIHRVAYCMYYGYWPENQIDHINRNKIDNRIENLREVSQSCNIRNTGNIKSNTSGVKGVSKNKRNSWIVFIIEQNQHIYLGSYDCFEQAVRVRYGAELLLGWERCDAESPAYQYLVENKIAFPDADMFNEIQNCFKKYNQRLQRDQFIAHEKLKKTKHIFHEKKKELTKKLTKTQIVIRTKDEIKQKFETVETRENEKEKIANAENVLKSLSKTELKKLLLKVI